MTFFGLIDLEIMMHPLLQIFEITGTSTIGLRCGPIGANVYYPNRERKMCVCGRNIILNNSMTGISADIIGTSAVEYPDHIGGLQSMISLRMFDALKSFGAKGFSAHPIAIASVESKILQKKTPPKYFLLEVNGKIDLDRKLWDGFDGDLCETCKSWRPRPGGKVSYGSKTTIPLMDTWDGSDFLRCGRKKSMIAIAGFLKPYIVVD